MIRFIIFLLVTAGLAFTAAWLADRPGAVSIDWLGYHADTSFAVLVGVVLAIVCAVLLLWTLASYLLRAPGRLRRGSRQRRATRGHQAVAKGLVAIGAGDVHAALRHARDAARHAADQPLTLLLQAQTAQLAGTRNGADPAFRAMAKRPETKLLGLRGLFIEAQRRNDAVAARGFAEEAAKAAPSLAWAGQATFDFHCADGDWAGALEALERNNRGGLLDKDTYRRQRAVLLTAQALSLETTDRAAASALAQEAVKMCPGLTPAATLAGRMLAEAGERRRAGRILEAAWREEPHPDIADTYADIVPGASARERLARMRTLARMAESHLESRLAVAARRARCARVRRSAGKPQTAGRDADPARCGADGPSRRGRNRRRRPCPRMDGARGSCRARSGMDRRRADRRALDAGVAGNRPARCVPLARAGRRPHAAGPAARAGALGAGDSRAERSRTGQSGRSARIAADQGRDAQALGGPIQGRGAASTEAGAAR